MAPGYSTRSLGDMTDPYQRTPEVSIVSIPPAVRMEGASDRPNSRRSDPKPRLLQPLQMCDLQKCHLEGLALAFEGLTLGGLPSTCGGAARPPMPKEGQQSAMRELWPRALGLMLKGDRSRVNSVEPW